PISPELLSAYVDSELPPDTSTRISEHLAMCSRCSSEYQGVLATVAALRSTIVRYPAPDTLRARVRGAVAAQPLSDLPSDGSSVLGRRTSSGVPRWASVAAAIVCLALGSGATAVAM